MPTRGSQHTARRAPLTVRIPLLLSAILVVVMAVSLAAAYSTLRSTSLDRAHQRLVRATRQLATVGAESITDLQERYAPAARDSLVVRALRGERVDATPVLARVVRQAGDTNPVYSIALWSAAGQRVASLGAAPGGAMRVERGRPEMPPPISHAISQIAKSRSDSLRVSPLSAEGNQASFWFVMPVRDGARTIGYIAHERRITPIIRTQSMLRDLSGDSVTVYYHNIDGTAWTGAGGAPPRPLQQYDPKTGFAQVPGGERVLFDEARVGSTPWTVGLAISEQAVLSRTEPIFQRLLWLSVAALGVGVLAAWFIGRSVARPLAQFTRAAESLAAGDYTARVPTDGDPEVRRIAESLNHMAGEIDASRRALEQQTLRAKSASNAKSQFLTTMSHELRTPLNAIGGYVDLLDMELRGPLTAAQKRDLGRIRASQQHLLGLISGVLDLARVEAGKVFYDIANVPVDAFLTGIEALIEPQAAAKGVRLHYQPPTSAPAVVADREKLRQILLNLLSNAIRHTPSGGTVTLSAEELGDRVQIVVQDTGPGIREDKRDDIFEPFVQLDRSLAQPGEGLGLGLAISRDLARGMSGDLEVARHDLPGARFVLTLNRGDADDIAPLVLTGEYPA